MAQLGQFVLINLEGNGSFVFDLFPREIQTSRRVTWEPQDITRGTKPLFYSNRDPKRIAINEVVFDGTELKESIEPQLTALYALQNEDSQLGRPPVLLAIWGDRQERCVLEDITIVEKFFSPEGEPLRAIVSLQLVEIQETGDATGLLVNDEVEAPAEIRTGRPVFGPQP
jgi:Contractile injection system tube protein